jgi:hypothetical protein
MVNNNGVLVMVGHFDVAAKGRRPVINMMRYAAGYQVADVLDLMRFSWCQFHLSLCGLVSFTAGYVV